MKNLNKNRNVTFKSDFLVKESYFQRFRVTFSLRFSSSTMQVSIFLKFNSLLQISTISFCAFLFQIVNDYVHIHANTPL